MLVETRRRFERLLRGEILPLPSKRGSPQRIVWDQDTFKDVLETAAFTPAAPSYRRALGWCVARTVDAAKVRARMPKLPSKWKLLLEQVHFFELSSLGRERSPMPMPMPSAWLPLHLPPSSDATFAFSSAAPVGPHASKGCNGSDVGGELIHIRRDGKGSGQLTGARVNGSYGAVPCTRARADSGAEV